MGSQRVGHDWATDLIWSDIINSFTVFHFMESLMYLIHFSSYWTCWLFATVLLLHQGCKGHPPAKSWHVTFTTSSGQIPWRVAAGGGAPSPLPRTPAALRMQPAPRGLERDPGSQHLGLSCHRHLPGLPDAPKVRHSSAPTTWSAQYLWKLFQSISAFTFSFCSPSRGPTSTIFTCFGNVPTDEVLTFGLKQGTKSNRKRVSQFSRGTNRKECIHPQYWD